MAYGETRLTMGGFAGLFTVMFLGVWSGFVIFFFTKFFDFWPAFTDIPLAVFILIGGIMAIFAFVLVFNTLPRFFRGLYYLLSQNPVMLLNHQGLHLFYPYRGDIRWDNIENIYFMPGRRSQVNIVIKTRAPIPLAKRLSRPWKSFFSLSDTDEYTVRITIQEMGLKVSKVYAALESYAQAHSFKLERL